MVARLTADRARTLDEEWKAVTARHLTRYDTAERDAWLAEENRIAEWHREYRAKYELEQRLAGWTDSARASGRSSARGATRAASTNTSMALPVSMSPASSPLDDQPGEPGELSVYREASLDAHRLDAPSTPCWSRRTNTRRCALARLERRRARRGTDVLAMYDDAGDSLLHVLPGTLGGGEPAADRGGRKSIVASGFSRTRLGSIDFEFNTLPSRIAERYALIVSYHYCHPPGTAG